MSLIRNSEQLGVTPLRRDALEILEAGIDGIDTGRAVARQVSYDGRTLSISGHTFDLSGVRRLHVIGFGKASCAAAAALERILGSRIESGFVIGNNPATCETITVVTGTHPRPSPENAALSQRMMLHCQDMHEDDLVIVLVSGGGSALLCWPMTECEQGARLYEAARHADVTIQELNTVRKHISALKGGGLATLLWPARVIGLIFSDVPGTGYDMVASGPTYFDPTTIAEAQAVVDRYALGAYTFNETPKEKKYFERVDNIVLVSNVEALRAMAARARDLGYATTVAGDDFYEEPAVAIDRLLAIATPGSAVIAGGEFRLRVPKNAGSGGRNTHAALEALGRILPDDLFAAVASDGMDNTGAAGALSDVVTREHVRVAGLDVSAYLQRFDEHTFFSRSGDLIMTGPTEANVSDIMLLLRPVTA